MSAIEVHEPHDRPAGHALIRVGGGARARSDPRFRLRRSAEWGAATLGPTGWQVADTLLQPQSATVEGDDLVLLVGPSICVHVDGGVYEIAVPAAGAEAAVAWPDIAVPFDVTHAPPPPDPPARRPQAEVEKHTDPIPPPPPLLREEKKAEEKPKPAPTPTPARPWWLFALIAVVILAGAGYGGYAFLFKPPPVDREAGRRPPPSLDALSARQLIERGKPEEMFSEAQRRIALPPPGPADAMTLLETAGDAMNYPPALAAFARLYDPNKPRSGGVPEDPGQAAKYYQMAIKAGQNDLVADRDALRTWLESRKAGGDMDAPVILEKYWP
jgi:hypothetical protein